MDAPHQENDIDQETSDDVSSSDDVSNDVSAYALNGVDLNRMPIILGQECKHFVQMVEQETSS